jgi:hypothetical protein
MEDQKLLPYLTQVTCLQSSSTPQTRVATPGTWFALITVRRQYMSEFEKPAEEPEFEEDFDDEELRAMFAATLASVTGRYDRSVSAHKANAKDTEPL